MFELLPVLVLTAAFSEPAPLTPSTDAYPSLSPDGKTLLFQSDRSGRSALYFAEPDGSKPRVFLDSGDNPVVATWSPDGRRIAFAADVGDSPEIFVIGRDGRGRLRLTEHAGDDSHPRWSADGARVFFNSSRDTADPKAEWSAQTHDIYSVRAEGGDLRRHTRCNTICTYPAPSPDGKRLVYRKIVPGPGLNWSLGAIERNSEIFIADIDGGNERNLTSHAAFDGWPVWSPAGRFIAISSNRTGRPNGGQLVMIDTDTATATLLTDSERYSYVQPSFAGPGRIYASRVREALDGSWSYGHITVVPVEAAAEQASAAK